MVIRALEGYYNLSPLLLSRKIKCISNSSVKQCNSNTITKDLSFCLCWATSGQENTIQANWSITQFSWCYHDLFELIPFCLVGIFVKLLAICSKSNPLYRYAIAISLSIGFPTVLVNLHYFSCSYEPAEWDCPSHEAAFTSPSHVYPFNWNKNLA